MQKQIIYPGFIARVFATTLDMFFLSFALTPIVNFISKKSFLLHFRDYAINHGVNMNENTAIAQAFNSVDFKVYFTFSKFLYYAMPVFLVQLVLVGFYFIYFWHYKTWTPGKYLLGMRVVSEDTMGRPSIGQCIKRFLSCSIAILGIWSIVFTKKHQAMHDKIAHTIVVKA